MFCWSEYFLKIPGKKVDNRINEIFIDFSIIYIVKYNRSIPVWEPNVIELEVSDFQFSCRPLHTECTQVMARVICAAYTFIEANIDRVHIRIEEEAFQRHACTFNGLSLFVVWLRRSAWEASWGESEHDKDLASHWHFREQHDSLLNLKLQRSDSFFSHNLV